MTSSIGKTALGAALAAILALGAGSATAGVTVNYVNSEKFADLPFTTWDREEVLEQLSAHFKELGAKLPAGQDLVVDVTDIDLAGREYPNRRAGGDLRILQGSADWPIIELRYTLSAGGQVIDSGNARLSDMMYLSRTVRGFQNEALRYEKRMIDEWFDKAILKKKAD